MANANQLVTVGITGSDSGRFREINQYSLQVPLNDMGTSESIHTIIFHYIIAVLKEKMKKEETIAIIVNRN